MPSMLVSHKNVGKAFCCGYCYPEYGHSDNGKAKTKLRRQMKRRERQSFRKEVRNYAY